MKKKRGIISRIIRFILFFLLAVILLVNIFILLSGRTYLYKGIANTYLKGKAAPGIYDEEVFYNSTIAKSPNPESWLSAKEYNNYNLSASDENIFNELETTAFLVINNDSVIFEKYWGEHAKGTVSNSFSAAKTVVALLIGIAVNEGKIKSIDEPVGTYLPEYKEQGREVITIRHLLMMASGLDWSESGKNPLSDNAESYYGTDLRGMIRRQKVINAPGKKLNYLSGNSQILAFVLEAATKKSVSKYCEEKLWKPLGMTSDALWNLDKENGDEKAFCCLYATARDFAKIGKLFLNYGKVNGSQLVDSVFIAQMSTNPDIETDEGIANLRYGLHVWTYHNPTQKAIYCRGILGQYIISIPSENVIIVRLGSKRSENFDYETFSKKPNEYQKKYAYLVGHPIDLQDYLKIANKILKK